MTSEEKIRLDAMEPVDRMGIYEFIERDGSCKYYCVVVGAEHRKTERFISIIILKDTEEDTGYADSIGIRLPIGDFWVHCGMVTYARRDRLGRKVAKVGEKTRKKITRMIGIELGVISEPRSKVFESDTKPDYESLYYSLMHKALSQGVRL